MKLATLLLILVSAPLLAAGQEPAYRFVAKWDLSKAEVVGGELIKSQLGVPQVGVEAAAGRAATANLGKLEAPGIKRRIYGLRGEVCYRNVQGAAYLEMWSTLGGKSYFSRTLAETGPLAKLSGDSDWREFLLPFDRLGIANGIDSLQVNLVLPQGGEVFLRDLDVVEFRADSLEEVLAGPRSSWWTDKAGGWFGAIAGCVFGTLGALCGLLARRNPRFVRWLYVVGIALGSGMLLVGTAALLTRQPYGVWYPLVLAGVVAVTVFGMQTMYDGRRRREQELQRIAAMDAR
jgi:hypothetical protein